MGNHSESLLTAAQQKVAAEVLGAAFAQDPFMTYVFPNAATREKNLAKLFLPVIHCCLCYGGVELAPENGGALAWIPGKYLPLNLFPLLRSGLIWTPLTIGFPAFKRLQDHDSLCEHELISRAPKDFAYLWLVGVHPKVAGQGLGKQLIQSTLGAMCSRSHSACLLRTDNERNVPFYKKLGFKPIHTGIAPDSRLRYWMLSQELM